MNGHSVNAEVYQNKGRNTTGRECVELSGRLDYLLVQLPDAITIQLLFAVTVADLCVVRRCTKTGKSTSQRTDAAEDGLGMGAAEDLRFLDPKFGVAFLAQTIFLENDKVAPKPSRQPLEFRPAHT